MRMFGQDKGDNYGGQLGNGQHFKPATYIIDTPYTRACTATQLIILLRCSMGISGWLGCHGQHPVAIAIMKSGVSLIPQRGSSNSWFLHKKGLKLSTGSNIVVLLYFIYTCILLPIT